MLLIACHVDLQSDWLPWAILMCYIVAYSYNTDLRIPENIDQGLNVVCGGPFADHLVGTPIILPPNYMLPNVPYGDMMIDRTGLNCEPLPH